MSEQNRTEGSDSLLWVGACTEEERVVLEKAIENAYSNAPEETSQMQLQKVEIERAPAKELTDDDVVTVVFGEQSPHEVFLERDQLHLYPTLVDLALRINPGFLSEEDIRSITSTLLEHEAKHAEVAQRIGLDYRTTGVSFTKTRIGTPCITPSVCIRGECTIRQIKSFAGS